MKRYSPTSDVKPRSWVALLCVALLTLTTACSDRDETPVVVTPPAQSAPSVTLKQAAEPTPTTAPAHDSPAPGTQARVSDWLAPADRLELDLNFTMTNQAAEEVNLAKVIDRPTAMSFIFTRCGNQQMCPLIAITMAKLQRDLEAAGLTDKTRAIVMSYDPVYDTPERLKKYGEDRGIRFNNGAMLRPGVDQYRFLIQELGISVGPMPDGTFNHGIELLVFDHKGRFVRDYKGALWSNAAVVDDLRKLVQEQAQSAQ